MADKKQELDDLLANGYSEAKDRFEAKYSSTTGVATAQHVKTVEEAIEKCKIDLNVWEVYRVEVLNQTVHRKEVDQDMIFEKGKLTGHKIDRGNITLEPLVNIKLHLRLRQFNSELFIEKLVKKVPSAPVKLKKYPAGRTSNLLVPNLYDIHFDKLAFACYGTQETTPQKTFDIVEEAVSVLLERSSGVKFEHVLLPLGHDFFNHDKIADNVPVTTRGTPQHSAINWEEMTMLGTDLMVRIVDRLLEVAPVKIVAVPGNHDLERSWHLAHFLSAWYRNNQNISFDLLGGQRKYFRWGKTLIGMTHTVKGPARKNRLRSNMTNERKKDWAETDYRYWLLGDLHRESSEDVDGVYFDVMPSIAENDKWHEDNSFYHLRSCKATFYSKQDGLIGSAMYNLSK